MQLTLKEVKAAVHKEIHEGYRVKLLLPDIGMFINGFRVYPPNDKHPDSWIVLTPTLPPTKVRVVEFNPSLPLWLWVQTVCIDVVKEHMGYIDKPKHHKDVVLEDIEDKPIDFSGVPF